jgi:hypothetical protein
LLLLEKDRLMAEKEKSGDDLLSTVIGWYDQATDTTMDARKLSERDRDYYDNKQLTDSEVSTLNERGQPPVIINRIKAKVDTLLGLESQTRTDPKAYPRTPNDEQGAHAATDAIRFVCDKDRFPAKRSEVFKEIIIEGTGAAIVEVKARGEKRDISIRRIPWDRLVYDPHSVERNFSDAKYLGVVAWADLDDAKAIYGDKVEELFETSVADESETHGDKPKHKIWADGKRKRIRLVEMYYRRSGKWMMCVFNKAGFAVEPQESSYQDENGEPTCPIEAHSCHIDRENNRYGIVRQLIGPQDEINKRRSKALHLLVSRQTAGERGAVDNIQQLKKQKADPHGHIEYNPGYKFEFADTQDMAVQNLGLLQEAKAEIDAVGANAALQGKDKNSTSGRQDEIKLQNAITELAAVMDARTQWQQAVYRQIWARIKQFWTEEIWIRVTDDEKNVQFVGLNTPVTAAEQMLEQATQQGLPPEQIEYIKQQSMLDPRANEVVGTKNNTAQLDVDISLEDAPDVATLQAEQFEQLAQLAKAYGPQFMPIDLLIEASSLRNKDKLLERIQGGQQGPQGPQGPDPAMQQHAQGMMQAEQAAAGANVQGEQARAAQEAAKIEKIQAETALTVAKVENERLKPQMDAAKFDVTQQQKAQQMQQRAAQKPQ